MKQETFKTESGLELPLGDIKGKPYLYVPQRVQWFRHETSLEWAIETEIVHSDNDYTIARALIKDPKGRIVAMAHKREDKSHFVDHLEKAESSAIGRALGFLGFGTQFAVELLEEERLADAPTLRKEVKSDTRPSNAVTSTGQNGASPSTNKLNIVQGEGASKPGGHEPATVLPREPQDGDKEFTQLSKETANSGVYTGKTFEEIFKQDSTKQFEWTRKRIKERYTNDKPLPMWCQNYLEFARLMGVHA